MTSQANPTKQELASTYLGEFLEYYSANDAWTKLLICSVAKYREFGNKVEPSNARSLSVMFVFDKSPDGDSWHDAAKYFSGATDFERTLLLSSTCPAEMFGFSLDFETC